MAENGELGRMWKVPVVVYFNA